MISLPILDEPAGVADCNRPTPPGKSLLGELLAREQSFSAVEQFSRALDAGRIDSRLERYRSLAPASPKAGQQYAFEVDLDRCSGCKACVAACHALNGLDDDESFRYVGLLVGGSSAAPVMQHVTSACHHCLEPGCLAACPVNAYEKDPVTGIVKHLDDQCFGCQYCTLACPYDVPQYHAAKGIVRKCDMCAGRLAAGEPPACVQSCPHQAISITVVDKQQIVDDAETSHFLPGAPDPQLTLPATTYKTSRALPRNLLPADYYQTSAQHAHWPLVVMLVLTQLSVGAFTVGLAMTRIVERPLLDALEPLLVTNALVFGLVALAASVLHLGRPRYAFRAVLGLRHSWLSREIVAFGVFALLAALYAGVVLVGKWRHALESAAAQHGAGWLGWAVVVSGCAAIVCSAMIYAFTQRECWSFSRVAVRFALTAALLGISAVWLSALALMVFSPSPALARLLDVHGPWLCRALLAVAVARLAWDAAIFRHLLVRRTTPMKRSAQLMVNQLSNVTLARFAAGLIGGLLMPGLLLSHLESTAAASPPQRAIAAATLFLACLAGELLDRYLFFAACAKPRMPGASGG